MGPVFGWGLPGWNQGWGCVRCPHSIHVIFSPRWFTTLRGSVLQVPGLPAQRISWHLRLCKPMLSSRFINTAFMQRHLCWPRLLQQYRFWRWLAIFCPNFFSHYSHDFSKSYLCTKFLLLQKAFHVWNSHWTNVS